MMAAANVAPIGTWFSLLGAFQREEAEGPGDGEPRHDRAEADVGDAAGGVHVLRFSGEISQRGARGVIEDGDRIVWMFLQAKVVPKPGELRMSTAIDEPDANKVQPPTS